MPTRTFDKGQFIDGEYRVHDGRLTYWTHVPQHMYAAVNAMRAKRELKVTASEPQAAEFTGLVKSVERVRGTMPPTWEIILILASQE
jgi:hypothetical protein